MTADTTSSSIDTELIEQLTSEGLISMRDAAALYGRRTHKSTPTRHALKGVKLPDGRRVKLEAIRVAGALCTSKAAVLRFFAAQNDLAGTNAASAPTPAQQSRAAKRAAKEAASIFQKK